MDFKLHVVFIVSIIDLVWSVEDLQSHTSGFMDRNNLVRKAASGMSHGSKSVFSVPNQLRIIPGSTFTCSGNITGFTVGALVRCNNGQEHPRVEIWRGDDDDDDDDDDDEFYRISSVELRIPNNSFNSNGVYRVDLTQRFLHFTSGDFLAIYQPDLQLSSAIVQYTTILQNSGSVSFVNSQYTTSIESDEVAYVENQSLLIYPITGKFS